MNNPYLMVLVAAPTDVPEKQQVPDQYYRWLQTITHAKKLASTVQSAKELSAGCWLMPLRDALPIVCGLKAHAVPLGVSVRVFYLEGLDECT